MEDRSYILLVHQLFNLWRGFAKIVEEERQQYGAELGVTTAEQHLLWIVYFEKEATMAQIAKIGLWDLSTVMQIIKRLKDKQLVETKKKENDMRVSYVYLTKKGKEICKKAEQWHSPLFRFIHELYRSSNENQELLKQFVAFQKQVNARFNGQQFVQWIERTGKMLVNDRE